VRWCVCVCVRGVCVFILQHRRPLAFDASGHQRAVRGASTVRCDVHRRAVTLPAVVLVVPVPGILVSTVAPQSPKVVSIVAQVDTLASFSSPRSMASGASAFTFGPMTPTALLPRGNSFNGDKVPGSALSHLRWRCVSAVALCCSCRHSRRPPDQAMRQRVAEM
jgi:hypothetical protein